MATIAVEILLCWFVWSTSCGQGLTARNNESLLTEQLLNNYGPRTTRPVFDSNSTIDVTLRYIVTQVIMLDERHQALTVNGWFKMEWTDEKLTWNATEYNVDRISVEQGDIWLPDITLYNNIDGEFERQKESVFIRVNSEGVVVWAAPSIYTSSCKMDVSNFPFDTQTCILEFGSWIYDGYELNLEKIEGEDAEQTEFAENGIWLLMGVQVEREVRFFNCCPAPYPLLTFKLNLKRRHEFYLANILLPCILLSFLSMLVFYLPPESGEKISFGMTTILGLLLFQQMIADSLPPTADNAPIIGTYFTFIISMGCASVLVTSIILNIYCGSSERPVPGWIKSIILDKLGSVIGRKHVTTLKSNSYNRVERKPQEPDKVVNENNKRYELEFCGDIGKTEVNISRPRNASRRRSINADDNTDDHTSKTEDFEAQWREVAVILDRLFLVISLIIVTAAAVYVLRTITA